MDAERLAVITAKGMFYFVAALCMLFTLYMCFVNKAVRVSVEWNLGFALVAGLASGIWKGWNKARAKQVPQEIESGIQPSVQASEPKSGRKNNRRVQRGR